MPDVKVPSLSRASHESESRANTARRRPWVQPSRLDAPPAPPGFKHRWIRAQTNGLDDRINVSGKLREGYELVRGEEYPEYQVPTVEDGRHAGVITVGGLLLARIPEETVEERNTYYQSRAADQLQAADNELMKSNAHDTMRIDRPSRRSKVSFGGSKG